MFVKDETGTYYDTTSSASLGVKDLSEVEGAHDWAVRLQLPLVNRGKPAVLARGYADRAEAQAVLDELLIEDAKVIQLPVSDEETVPDEESN